MLVSQSRQPLDLHLGRGIPRNSMFEWDLPKVSIVTCLSWTRTVEMKWTMNLLQLKRLMPSLCPLYDVSLCEPRDVSEFFT